MVLLMAVFLIGSVATVSAQTSQSPNFELSEPEFGAGSALETCSGKYCAKASIGDISAGDTSSPSNRATFGSITSDSDPLLEVIIEPGGSNLGVLSTTKTATKETVVKIRTYLSDGYTLQIVGDPPKYQNHTLASSSSPFASSAGTEQFGINLVANSTPNIGADVVQTPSGDFSFGYVTAQYATTNQFSYQNGDVVARSDSESGQTDYTISMIINVANSTPAGHFSSDFAAVVIPAF